MRELKLMQRQYKCEWQSQNQNQGLIPSPIFFPLYQAAGIQFGLTLLYLKTSILNICAKWLLPESALCPPWVTEVHNKALFTQRVTAQRSIIRKLRLIWAYFSTPDTTVLVRAWSSPHCEHFAIDWTLEWLLWVSHFPWAIMVRRRRYSACPQDSWRGGLAKGSGLPQLLLAGHGRSWYSLWNLPI